MSGEEMLKKVDEALENIKEDEIIKAITCLFELKTGIAKSEIKKAKEKK